jgi:hypothetical protein
VTLGETYDDVIEIKSGLTEGAAVICSNINVLQDGDLIVPAEQPPAPAEEQSLAAVIGQPLVVAVKQPLAAVAKQSLITAVGQPLVAAAE